MRTLLVVAAACFACHTRYAPTMSVHDVVAVPERVRSADAEVHRDDPAKGVTAVAAMAKEHGGWVESMVEQRVVLRVPDEQLDAMLDELPKLGEVAERRVRAVDMGEVH